MSAVPLELACLVLGIIRLINRCLIRSNDGEHKCCKGGIRITRTLVTWWNWDSGSVLFDWRSLERQSRMAIHYESWDHCPITRVHRKRNGRWQGEKGALRNWKMSEERVTSRPVELPAGQVCLRLTKGSRIFAWFMTQRGVASTMLPPLACLLSSLILLIDERCTHWRDFGEMFLNFNFHSAIRPYAGVDLPTYLNSGGREETRREETRREETWWGMMRGWREARRGYARRGYARRCDAMRGEAIIWKK